MPITVIDKTSGLYPGLTLIRADGEAVFVLLKPSVALEEGKMLLAYDLHFCTTLRCLTVRPCGEPYGNLTRMTTRVDHLLAGIRRGRYIPMFHEL